MPRMNDLGDSRPTLRAFDGLAAGYDRHRPRYPEAIIDAIFAGVPVAPVVADVGCGTGISTRAIAARAGQVIGVDPGEDMLLTARSLSAAFSNIRFIRGTAEATTLADASVDVVLVAQAFHWFDAKLALAEFHRILRPGGRCALLWNLRTSDRGGFTDDYNRIVVSAADSIDPSARAARQVLGAPLLDSPLFTHATVVSAPSPQVLDQEGVIGRATSASYFPRQDPERASRLEQLHAAFMRSAKDGRVTLQQVAQLTIATRAEAADGASTNGRSANVPTPSGRRP